MLIVYFLASALFGSMYMYELLVYHIHNMEWLLIFMFFAMQARFEELKL